MNSREHLEDKLTTATARSKQVNYVAWGVAIFVMIYGTPIVFDLATAHGIPAGVAWMLSLAADASLCVGLIATPVLASLEVAAGWVGTLRWVAGFITWALQTGSSWTRPGGVDGVGVAVHTAGPLLLFFAVEAASYFHRKISAALTELRRELSRAEQGDADQRARRAEVDAKLRSTAAELSAARAEHTALTERLTALTDQTETDKAATALAAERYERTIADLQSARIADREHHTAVLDETVRKLKDKHREALTARAEAGAVSLSAYRNRSPGAGRPVPTGKAEISDEAAVQMMLTAHPDPGYEWSKNGVRTLTGAGVGRAPKLIGLWLTAATEQDSGKAVNE